MTKQEFIKLASKYDQESFLAMAGRGRNLESRHSDCISGRFGKVGSIRILSSKNQRARSIDITKGMMNQFILPFADGTAKLSGRDYELRECTPRREPTVVSEEFSRELHDEQGVSTDKPQMTLKLGETFGRYKVTSSIVITVSYEYNSICRGRKLCRFHWKTFMLQGLFMLMCCKRSVLTMTGMSIHVSILSGSWKGFAKFNLFETSKRIYVVQVEIDEDSNGYQTRLCMSRRVDEKVWRRRSVWHRVSENITKEIERLVVAPAMACKRNQKHSSIVKTNAEPKIGNEREFKAVCGCIVESKESTRQLTESLQFETDEDRIAGKGITSMREYKLVFWMQGLP